MNIDIPEWYVKNTYLVDVPETKSNKGCQNVRVILYTEQPRDNTESVAQFLAEADWYNINPNDYYKELPNGDVEVDLEENSYFYDCDYQVETSSFAEKLKRLIKEDEAMLQSAYPPKVEGTIKDLKELLEGLPSQFLTSRKYFHQVVSDIKETLLDKADEVNLYSKNGLVTLQSLYAIVCRRLPVVDIIHTNEVNNHINEEGRSYPDDSFPTHYWYDVRQLLSKGDFVKVEVEGCPKVAIKTGEATIYLDLPLLKTGTVRLSVFDNNDIFNNFMMNYEAKVEGAFSIVAGDKTIVELEGYYKIYRWDDLYAVVKNATF